MTDEYAYIANFSPTYTSVCTVTPGSGELTDCVDAISGYRKTAVLLSPTTLHMWGMVPTFVT